MAKKKPTDDSQWYPQKHDRFRPIGSDRVDDFIVVMAYVDHWVMYRHPSCVPQVEFIKEFRATWERYDGYKG